MSDTVTYTDPRTFCRCVVEDIAERGWKIQKRQTGSLIDLILPDNTRAAAPVAATALLVLCRQYADKFKLLVKYDPKATPEPKLKLPRAKKTTGVSEFKATHIFFPEAPFDEMPKPEGYSHAYYSTTEEATAYAGYFEGMQKEMAKSMEQRIDDLLKDMLNGYDFSRDDYNPNTQKRRKK